MGPSPWPGAREAILGATDRVVYAISGGKHLRDIRKGQQYAPPLHIERERECVCVCDRLTHGEWVCVTRRGRGSAVRSVLRVALLALALWALRTAAARRRLA
jgi:hypothetical protein